METAKLRIVRSTGYFGMVRSLNILINGHVEGSVAHNETKEFELVTGEYEVQVKMDWALSPPITIQLGTEGAELVATVVGSALLAGWRSLLFPKTTFLLSEGTQP